MTCANESRTRPEPPPLIAPRRQAPVSPPIATPRKSRAWWIAAGALGLAAIAVAAILGARAATGPTTLKADISFWMGALVIDNDSDEDWREMWVTINQHYRRVDVIDCVVAGEDATCGLSNFVTETGERFDPDKQAVMRVDISAQTESGRGTFTWKRPAP